MRIRSSGRVVAVAVTVLLAACSAPGTKLTSTSPSSQSSPAAAGDVAGAPGASDSITAGGSPTPESLTTPATVTTPKAGTSPAPGASPKPSATTSPKAATSTARGSSGRCARPKGAAPVVRVRQVEVGAHVAGDGGASDTSPLPSAIAASPDGTSWLAWLGTDEKVHLGRLDCDDKLVGRPTTFDGIDLQDVAADATGGVLLLTRPGPQGSGKLCGGSSSPTRAMYLVRFDTSGRKVWERQVTNLSAGRGGYDDGARFVWWYQHHGRLAYDGHNYAAYFGTAITVRNGSCVDIHEGDRMQVVGPSGQLVSGRGSFEVGCSHAWTSRITWDPRASRFVMVCATDNACRIAQPSPYRTVVSAPCDGTLFVGDVVNAARSGYWTAWSRSGQARLSHFSTGAADTTIDTGASTAHPHLVGYGTGRMLLAWGNGSSTVVQSYDASTGKAVGARVTAPVRDHAYTAYEAYPDGSVAFPAAGATATSLRIARVLPQS